MLNVKSIVSGAIAGVIAIAVWQLVLRPALTKDGST